MNIIFDLDGTLIDSSDRMYKLFCTLVPQCRMSKAQYWDYKRNKINHEQLIMKYFPEINFEIFRNQWMKLIESDYYLAMDVNYIDTIKVLQKLQKQNILYLLTARQNKEGLIKELDRLELRNFFEKIFTTEGKCSKQELWLKMIQKYEKLDNKDNVFISDMGMDILIGNRMGYKTVAISHGFMNREKLQEYIPDVIIDELEQLLAYC